MQPHDSVAERAEGTAQLAVAAFAEGDGEVLAVRLDNLNEAGTVGERYARF